MDRLLSASQSGAPRIDGTPLKSRVTGRIDPPVHHSHAPAPHSAWRFPGNERIAAFIRFIKKCIPCVPRNAPRDGQQSTSTARTQTIGESVIASGIGPEAATTVGARQSTASIRHASVSSLVETSTLHARLTDKLKTFLDNPADADGLAQCLLWANPEWQDEPITPVQAPPAPPVESLTAKPVVEVKAGDGGDTGNGDDRRQSRLEEALIRWPSLVGGRRSDKKRPATHMEYIKKLWDQRINAAQDILGAEVVDAKLLGKLEVIRNKTRTREDRFKGLEDKLIELIAEHLKQKTKGLSDSKAAEQAKLKYRKAVVDALNAQPWPQIERKINYKGTTYTHTLTPAGEIRRGGHNIFEVDYKDTSVSSGSKDCTVHATNLWRSELRSQDGSILFLGFRSGVLSPYGLSLGDKERQVGAVNRAKEVMTYVLAAQPGLLQQALGGDTVTLSMTSTALLTPVTRGKHAEGDMLDDQMRAWKSLADSDHVELKIRDHDGQLKSIRVKLEIAAFNFGVNELALLANISPINDSGWKKANGYNAVGMKKLNEMVTHYLDTNPGAANISLVKELSGQINTIWEKKLYQSDGGEAYKMTWRIAWLSHAIGVAPHWNCKSGKDRTAGNAGEILRAVIQWNKEEPLAAPGSKLNEEQQKLLDSTWVDSGNEEIQILNTGAPGNKIMKKFPMRFMNLSHWERMGGSVPFTQAKGLSGLVKA